MQLKYNFLYKILMISSLLVFKNSVKFGLLSKGILKSNRKKHITMAHSSSSSLAVARLAECDSEGLRAAGLVLKAGGLVAFPTETVYGLGANALNDSSVKSIFTAKKRPSTDPLIVHILSKDNIYDLFDFEEMNNKDPLNNKNKSQLVCEQLAEKFWPGPLTIIFKAKSIVPLSVTAGSGYVGLRSPKHPIARLLLEECGLPIAAPSANRFGHVSPTSAEHVYNDLKDENITILRDNIKLTGGCTIGIESTVCRVSKNGDTVSILRCGAVTSIDILNALTNIKGLENVFVVVENEKSFIKKTPEDISQLNIIECNNKKMEKNNNDSNNSDNKNSEVDIRTEDEREGAVAPGQMIKHYAPDIPTYIISLNKMRNKNKTKGVFLSTENLSTYTATVNNKENIIDIREAFVIDFNGQLRYMSEICGMYCDLSVDGQPEQACNRIFEVLRLAEDPLLAAPLNVEEVEISGEDGRVKKLVDNIIISNNSNSGSRDLEIVVAKDKAMKVLRVSGKGVKVVLLPDLRKSAEQSEMVRALWERLHRAASGIFVY